LWDLAELKELKGQKIKAESKPKQVKIKSKVKASQKPKQVKAKAESKQKQRHGSEDPPLLTAVDGGVTDVLALDDVDDVFGDVGGMVADAFEIFRYEDQLEGWEDHAGIAHHVGEEFAEDLVTVVIDFVVAGENFLRELDVAADHGVEGLADLFFGKFAHARKVDVGLDARVAENAQGTLGNIYGLVADALEVIVDARDGQDEAQVSGHQLVESEELHDAVVDFELQFVDGGFLFEDAASQGFVGIQDGVDGLMDGAFGEAAHPEQALFYVVEIFFKMPFHGFLPVIPQLLRLWRAL
jgi:hypothetical protein